MSCFIVSDEHIDRVVQAFERLHPLADDTARTVTGRRFIEMNNDAFAQRYEGRYPDELADPTTYNFESHEATTGELYKAVQCFLYQCSEGNVPETDLFKLTMEVNHALEAEMTNNSVPSNKRAERAMSMVETVPWGF